MTGGEILGGAASAAAKGVQKALSEDESTKAQLARMSEETPEMKAAATAYAKRVAIRQQIVLQIMRPLGRLAGFSKEYFDNTFSDELAEKLANVPEDQVQSPPPNIAVPAMQALSYSLDEADLKDMYLNLLANASDKRQAESTHPAFAEVIKQLSSREALMLGQILQVGMIPIVKVKVTVESGGHQMVHHNMIEITHRATGDQIENPNVSAWIDNWVRLGLVERDFANFFTAAGKYDWTEKRPEVARLREGGKAVSYDKGVLRATDFGRRFASAVGSDEKAVADSETWREIRQAFQRQKVQKEESAHSGSPDTTDEAQGGSNTD